MRHAAPVPLDPYRALHAGTRCAVAAALLLGVVAGAGAQTDPLRFFPLGDGDAWLFEATHYEDGVGEPLGYERWTVEGDTTIQGVERRLLRQDLYLPGAPLDEPPAATARCAVVGEASAGSLALTFADVEHRCHNFLSVPAPPGYTVFTATGSLSTFPATVVIGGIPYDLPEVAYGVHHVHTTSATYFSEWWLGRDLGLYRHRRGVISADSTAADEYALQWALVGGVEYGSIPVAAEPGPDDDVGPVTLRVWPNPTAGHLHVDAAPGAVLAEVFDGMGRRVATGPLQAGRGTLDLRLLPRGRYLVRIADMVTVVSRR